MIISRPKQHALPFQISKRLASSESEIKLPEIYVQSKSNKKRVISKHLSNSLIISYAKGQNQLYRHQIRKALATCINFQHNNGQYKFLPEEIIKKIREPVKAISYNSQKFSSLYKNVKQIFGADFDIADKEILAASGTITFNNYIFFTAAYYQPFSLCCKEPIYLLIQVVEADQINKYIGKESSFLKNGKVITNFVCSKCLQSSLKIQSKSQKFIQDSRAIDKQQAQFQVERQKIGMSIMVSSGRFKRMRLRDISQKQITLPDNKGGNPQEQEVYKKSHTMVLKHIQKKRYLQSCLS